MNFKFENNRGASLSEVLIASFLLLSTVGGLSYFLKDRSRVNNQVSGRACVLHVNKIMSGLSQIGMSSTAMEAIATGATINLSAGGQLQRTSMSAGEHIDGIDDRHRIMTAPGFPGAPILLETDTPPVLRSSILVNNAVAAVQAIYNSARRGGTAICNTGVDYDDRGLPVAERLFEPNQLLKWKGQNLADVDVTTTVQIATYNTTTGAPSCLASPVITVPRGRAFPPEAVAAGLVQIPNVSGAPQDSQYNFYSDVGFLVTVRATYIETDPNGGQVTKSCETSQKFQTPADNVAPVTPSVSLPSVVNLNGTDTCNVIDRDVTNLTFQKRIGFTVANPPQGSVILCRDMSLRRLPMAASVDASYGAGAPSAIRTELCATQNHIDNYIPPNPPAIYEDGNGPDATNLRRACFVKRDDDPSLTYATTDPYGMNPSGTWQPCEQLSVCNSNTGGPASVDSVTVRNDGNQVTYDLNFNFNKNHYGCDIKVDAVAVDPAGNLSGVQRVIDEPMQADATHAPGGTSGDLCWDRSNNFFHSTWNDGSTPTGTYFHNCAGGCIPPCAGPGSQNFTSPGANSLTVTADMAGCEFTIRMHGADGGSSSGAAGTAGSGEGGSMQFDYTPGQEGTFRLFIGRIGSSSSTGRSLSSPSGAPGGGASGGIISRGGWMFRAAGGGGASAVMFESTMLAVAGGGGGGGSSGLAFPSPSGGSGGDGGAFNNAGRNGRTSGITGPAGRGGSRGSGGFGGGGSSSGGRGGSNSDGSPSASGSNPGLQPAGWSMLSGGGGGGTGGGGGGGGYGGGGGGGYLSGSGGGGGYLNTSETSNARSYSPTRPRRGGGLNGGIEISWEVP